jgi:hypothetical protein
MLQAYVINVSSVSDVCYIEYFMVQVFHEQTRQGGTCEGGPLGHSIPACAWEAKWARQRRGAQGYIHRCGNNTEHEAVSIGGQQARSTR